MKTNATNNQAEQDMTHYLSKESIGSAAMLLCLVTVFCLFTVSGANAAIIHAIANVVGAACGIIAGLGTLAIIVLGITAMFGRLTWSQALLIAVGIAIATAAATIFTDVSGKSYVHYVNGAPVDDFKCK